MLVACEKGKNPFVEPDLSDVCHYNTSTPIVSVTITAGEYNQFETDDAAELVDCIPVQRSKIGRERNVYSVKFLDLREGDVIEFSAYGEVTNELPEENRAMIVSHMRLTASPYDTETIEEVTEAYGYNCERYVHHCMIPPHTRYYKVKQDYPEIYLSMVIYSAALGFYDLGLLIVERDYGGVSGRVHRE